ncbi:ribonuclease HII [Candidatus Saccharibacteria bacterium]|nr:ribonuclease HII [Candidatus Saccharibacteria bacterium]
MILGIDEVGRGPWAGPLVVGAVVLGGARIDGLTDSKKLSKKRREELDAQIREKAAGFGLGWVSAAEIDEIGLSSALQLATRRAVEQVNTKYTEIIIDGTVNFLSDTNKGKYVTMIKKADLLIPAASAASIIAKVARDNYMAAQDAAYPGYNFASHVGYGTAAHQTAIKNLGVTPLHRLSFSPLKKYSPQKPQDVDRLDTRVTTKQIGDDAESEVAQFLQDLGHRVLDRNWKTKFCEIDIISSKRGVIYFTEVKYRKNPDQGGGLAAVTPRKLRQMKFAVEYYALLNQIDDTNLRLLVASASGCPAAVDDLLEVQ